LAQCEATNPSALRLLSFAAALGDRIDAVGHSTEQGRGLLTCLGDGALRSVTELEADRTPVHTPNHDVALAPHRIHDKPEPPMLCVEYQLLTRYAVTRQTLR
jgi:hypothetical protein